MSLSTTDIRPPKLLVTINWHEVEIPFRSMAHIMGQREFLPRSNLGTYGKSFAIPNQYLTDETRQRIGDAVIPIVCYPIPLNCLIARMVYVDKILDAKVVQKKISNGEAWFT